MEADKRWFVFYTKARHEKKAKELLERGGFDVFLPLHKVLRQWSDRKKKVEVPLFNSYIFVRDHDYNIPRILQNPSIAWNIKLNGRPAVLRENEYDVIQRFIQSGLSIEASTVPQEIFEKGDEAMVIDGPLKNVKGRILGFADVNTFFVLLDGINHAIKAEIPSYLLKKL